MKIHRLFDLVGQRGIEIDVFISVEEPARKTLPGPAIPCVISWHGCEVGPIGERCQMTEIDGGTPVFESEAGEILCSLSLLKLKSRLVLMAPVAAITTMQFGTAI